MSIHSKIPFGMLLVLFLSILNGCSPSHPSPTVTTTPTRPSTYTSTYTPTPTQTQTQTSTPDPVMSTGNAGRIAELARLGKGMMGKAIWSPDGKFILVPYSTGIYRFDSASLAESVPLETTTPANSIAFSPDGTMLASTIGQYDNSILLWNVSDGKLLRSIIGPTQEVAGPSGKENVDERGFRQIQFSPDGTLIAAMGIRTGDIHIWNISNGTHLQTIDVWKGFESYLFSTDGKFLFTASSDAVVRSYKVSDGKLMSTYNQAGYFISLSPDGTTMALGSYSQDVILMRMSDGAFLFKLKGSKEGIEYLNFSPDGKLVAGIAIDGGLYLWNVADGKLLNKAEPAGHIDIYHSVQAAGDWEWAAKNIAFSPDGSFILQQSGDDTIQMRRVQDWSIANTFKDYSYSPTAMVFSKDGNTLNTIQENNRLQWNILNGKLSNSLNHPGGFGGYLAVFSSDGIVVASDCWNNNLETACVWNTADNTISLSALTGRYVLTGLDLSPDGQILATVRYPEESTRLWNVTRKKSLFNFPGFIEPKFSPDGMTIAMSEGKVPITNGFYYKYIVHFIALSTGKQIGILNASGDVKGSIEAKIFSPDGNTLAIASMGGVDLWKVPDGVLLRRWSIIPQSDLDSYNLLWDRWQKSVAFSPDGKIIASGSYYGVVRIWRTEDGTLLKILKGHTYGILNLMFSPDGKYLASSSSDGTVRIWGIPQ